jgi:hypothetical protein
VGCAVSGETSEPPEATESVIATEAETEPTTAETTEPTTEPLSSEDFAAIRAGIPYEGMTPYFIDNPILETGETEKKLERYLSLIDFAGVIAESVSDIDNEHIISTAVMATHSFSSNPEGGDYRSELKPFETSAEELLGFPESAFWLKEHVDETIRLLYGDVSYTHQSFLGDKWPYLEPLGVYTPPHMGGFGVTHSEIFSYEEMADQIVAEVAYYIGGGYGGYFTREPGDEYDEFLPEEELEEYVQTKAPRYTVTVNKQPDGRFVIESQIIKKTEELTS